MDGGAVLPRRREQRREGRREQRTDPGAVPRGSSEDPRLHRRRHARTHGRRRAEGQPLRCDPPGEERQVRPGEPQAEGDIRLLRRHEVCRRQLRVSGPTSVSSMTLPDGSVTNAARTGVPKSTRADGSPSIFTPAARTASIVVSNSSVGTNRAKWGNPGPGDTGSSVTPRCSWSDPTRSQRPGKPKSGRGSTSNPSTSQ